MVLRAQQGRKKVTRKRMKPARFQLDSSEGRVLVLELAKQEGA